MGKSQRTKGAAGEREVCAMLREHLGIDAKRNLSQVREGGCDIVAGPYRLEVKRRSRIGNIYDWMEQAKESCRDGGRPIVVCRADGKKWLAVMLFEEVMRLFAGEIK